MFSIQKTINNSNNGVPAPLPSIADRRSSAGLEGTRGGGSGDSVIIVNKEEGGMGFGSILYLYDISVF